MPTSIPRNTCADILAADCVRLRSQLRRASDSLHDDIGSPLAAVGMILQLLRMDYPKAEPQLAEMAESLDSIMALVRELSRELATSPVRPAGFRVAMEDLVHRHATSTGALVNFKYSVLRPVPTDVGDALYQVTELILSALPTKTKQIRISVTGARHVEVRIRPDIVIRNVGSGLTKAALIANNFGLLFGFRKERVTILSVKYAF